MMRILFVCESNLVRSPLAAAIFNRCAVERGLDIRAESAGSYCGAFERPATLQVRELAEKRGLSLAEHRTRELPPERFSEFNAYFALDEASYWRIEPFCVEKERRLRYLAELSGNLGLRDIPEPIQGEMSYADLFELLSDLCVKVIEFTVQRGNL